MNYTSLLLAHLGLLIYHIRTLITLGSYTRLFKAFAESKITSQSKYFEWIVIVYTVK